MAVFGLLVGLSPVFSAIVLQTSVGLSGDVPIDVSAGRCEVDEIADTITCTGDVRVSQNDAIMTADQMIIHGATSGDGFERIEGQGSVRYASGPNAVSGEEAIYDGPSSTITVTGDVVVIQDGQVMAGGRLIYNTITKSIVFEPGPDGRVRGLFSTASSSE